MLIYTKKSEIDEEKEGEEVEIPEEIMKEIREDNERLEKQLNLFQQVFDQKKQKWEEEKNFIHSFLSKSVVSDPQNFVTCPVFLLFVFLPFAIFLKEFKWVSKEWLKECLSGHDVAQIENKSLLCEHFKLNPLKVEDAKRVSEESWKILREKYGEDVTVISTDLCVDCVFDMAQKERKEKEEKEHLLQIKHMLNSQPLGAFFWLSSSFLSEWKQDLTVSDAERDANEDIKCEHGSLKPKEKENGKPVKAGIAAEVWSFLSFHFPSSTPFLSNTPSCPTCLSLQQQSTQQLAVEKQTRELQKVFLSSLYLFFHLNLFFTLQKELMELFRFDLRKKQRVDQLNPGKYSLICFDWLRNWKEYIDQPLNAQKQLNKFNLKPLICKHNKLLYNVHPTFLNEDTLDEKTKSGRRDPFILIPSSLFLKLHEFYGFNVEEGNEEEKGSEEEESVVHQIEVKLTHVSTEKKRAPNSPQWKTVGKGNTEKKGVKLVVTTDPERCQECITDREFREQMEVSIFKDGENLFLLLFMIFNDLFCS